VKIKAVIRCGQLHLLVKTLDFQFRHLTKEVRKMNNKQRCVVVSGFIVILLLGLFPPWLEADQHPGNPRGVYEFYFELRTVFAPRLVRCGYFDQHWRVDTSLLLVEWFLVSAVTGIMVVFLGDRPQRLAQERDK
jgi:hypothetical protein